MKTFLWWIAAVTLSVPANAASLAPAIRADLPDLLAIYRDLHQHPELSMQEVRTSAILASETRKLGFKVTEKVGKTGIVAVLENGPGPVVLVRADMDALPVVEQTGLPYASKTKAVAASGVETGVMHACGHDTHMTAWVGVARQMAAVRGSWSGTLVMIGQPGEETSEGAKAMIADGLFSRFPKPHYALAFHDAAAMPAGTIGISKGYATASVDSVDITVRGHGGHGAFPHTTKDPIVLASRIVLTLQTLISRELDPLSPAVVTVGSFHAGAKHNIIPDEAKLQLTVRSFTPEARQALLDGIARIARGEAIASGVPDDRMPIVTVSANHTPSTFNSEGLSTRALDLFTRHFGDKRVIATPSVMFGEDFGRFRIADKTIESLMIWVGGTPKAKWDEAGGDTRKLPSLHSPFWAPDAEAVIATATEALTLAALDLMKK